MKRQYLGDSKDSFTWDYHDYLTSALGYRKLEIILMLTPDDNSGNGTTRPELFPARETVISFCHKLRQEKNVRLLCELPTVTGSAYAVDFHDPETYFTRKNRIQYFARLPVDGNHLLFLDPDNGFEPENSNNEKHVLFAEIDTVLNQMSRESVISIFQHFRRVPFEKDFSHIKERLTSEHIAAVSWHSLMFVAIAKTKQTIEKVIAANHHYAQKYPVKVIL
jgi:hypothetical protein